MTGFRKKSADHLAEYSNHPFICKHDQLNPQLHDRLSKAVEVTPAVWTMYSCCKNRPFCWYWTFNLICCIYQLITIFNTTWSPARCTICFGSSPSPPAADSLWAENNCLLLQYLQWLWPSCQYANIKGICKILDTSLQTQGSGKTQC